MLGCLLLTVLLLAGCGSGGASTAQSGRAPRLASARAGMLALSGGWVAAVDMGTGGPMMKAGSPMNMNASSVAYGVITNAGSTADRLVGASTSAAAAVQIHTTVVTGGGTSGTMVRVTGVRIPAGGSATLQPGGYHMMLMGLRRSLVPGMTVDVTLRFASGTVMHVAFPVIDRVDRPESGGS